MTAILLKAKTSLLLSTLVLVALAAACGSDTGPASDGDRNLATVPAVGSSPELTAQQIYDRAQEAVKSLVSLTSEGEVLIYGTNSDTETTTWTSVWNSSGRVKHINVSTNSSETVVSEHIYIEDYLYTRSTNTDNQWREYSGIASTIDFAPAELLANVIIEEPAEVVDMNGSTLFKITGAEDERGASFPPVNGLIERENRVAYFISPSDFRVMRFERNFTHRVTNDVTGTPAPEGTPPDEEMVVEMWFDFAYSDEPLTIAAPENYIPAGPRTGPGPQGPASAPEPILGATPTPVVLFPMPGPLIHGPTPTAAVPIPPAVLPTPAPTTAAVVATPHVMLPTTAPLPTAIAPVLPTEVSGPIPIFPPEEPYPYLPVWLKDIKRYDKLELENDIVAIYTECSLNSIIDRPYGEAIFYRIDGSRAFSRQLPSTLDPNDPSGFPDRRFFSEEGRVAIEAVLHDPDVMTQIIEMADRSARCPEEFQSFVGDTFTDLPETDYLVIDEQLVARFESCDTTGENLAAPILIAHLPSESVVAMTPGSYLDTLTWQSQPPKNRDHLWTSLRDGFLRRQLTELAPREARCGG